MCARCRPRTRSRRPRVAIGAAFAGQLGVTATSGPGVDLKGEALGLAISLELPLVLIDVQRGGPSTGLPTKTEQSDLLLAMYGRHGESPLPIVAAKSPSHCFDAAFEAVRIALKYRTPVILLTDGYLANGAEPWLLPDVHALPDISVPFAEEPNHGDEFWPYLRDPETLARPWAIPGTPGLMHRIGGIEKQEGTGNINYEPANHELHDAHPRRQGRGDREGHPAGRGRRRRRRRRARPRMGEHVGPDQRGGAPGAGRRPEGRARPPRAPQPVPREPRRGAALATRKVLVPEMNLGQLAKLVRAEFLVDAQSLTKVQGLAFSAAEIEAKLLELING